MKNEKLIVILGPTAVGKTDLSIELAKRLSTEIISGDSMLVYKGFDIGAAKPTLEERQGIVHHLVDILEPDESFSVTDFKMLAEQKITMLNQRGCLPVLAGGTGLYIKALVEDYQFNITKGDDAYRRELELLAEQKGKAYVHQLLEAEDPHAAARLHVNDFRRVIRALEVVRLGNERISQKKTAVDGQLAYDVYLVGLRRERRKLYERINQRVELMFAQGLEEEVRTLLAHGVTRDMQAMQGIGYKETAAWIAGEISRPEALYQIQKSTRHFAKRQLTWYRKMPYIHWYDVDDMLAEELLEKVYQDIAGYFKKE